MKKHIFLKAVFAGIVVFLALSLVTCGDDLSGGVAKGTVEYTDVVYSPDGKSVTLYLDGEKVPVTPQQRALSLEIARRSHDYFEAVFIAGAAGGPTRTVARASWEIGQAAGIRGVKRTIDYGSSDPTTSASDSTGAAIIFVGRKVSNGIGTLLGVGWVTHVDGSNSTTTIGVNAKSVTFTVTALQTRVGFDFSEDTVDTTPTSAFTSTTGRDTFLTATLDASGTPPYRSISAGNTNANIAVFKNGAAYTLFGLPNWDDGKGSLSGTPPPDNFSVYADYKIIFSEGPGGESAPATLGKGILYDYGAELTAPIVQVIPRLGIYQIMGQTYDVTEAPLDVVTDVKYRGTQPSANGEAAFIIPLEFLIKEKSNGAFAFTFQFPVYALAYDAARLMDPPAATPVGGPALATNGGPEAIKWYVRPGHGQAQYLLDDGQTAGGAVLMGVNVGAIDWLEIYVNGFGFTN